MKLRILKNGVPLSEVAAKAGAVLHGDPDSRILGLCSLEAPREGYVTFARVKSPSALNTILAAQKCSALVISNKHPLPSDLPGKMALLTAPDPYSAFLKLVPLFYEAQVWPVGIHATAAVASTAKIGADVFIGPGCTVGENVIIGNNVVLTSNVTLYENVEIGHRTTIHAGVSVRELCRIGEDCTIHNNAVIGVDGFGYVPNAEGELVKVPQVGRVIIENRVEIGANACIDRGAFGDTIIGRGTKIDNLAQIGHNVVMGANVVICGQVGIAGSVIIGDHVVLGGQAGVGDHVRIASGCRVAAQSGVTTNLTERGDYAGFPAVPARSWRRQIGTLSRISERPAKGVADTVGDVPTESSD